MSAQQAASSSGTARPTVASAGSPGAGRPAPAGAALAPGSAAGSDAARPIPGRTHRLCTLLAATAQAHPDRVVFADPPHKPVWSGRAAITWTYGAAAEIVARLANGIRGWRLPAASRIGLSLAGSSESFLAYLAVEAAGHIPCLLPLAMDEEDLVTAVQAAGIAAVLTQARFGPLAPAERLCRVAARYFGLRYLAAFGPEVPDGVMNLDAMVLDQSGGPFVPGPGGFVSFAAGRPDQPIHRGGDALLAAIAVHLVTARIAPGDRILSLLPASDLRGLVTGLGAALVAGAGLETLPVFEAASFAAALAHPVPTRLVAPAGLERNLAASLLPETLVSLVLVHRAPTDLGPPCLDAADPARAVIDVVAFDETALLTGARSGSDVALTLANPERGPLFSTLMALRRDPAGILSFRGRACQVGPLRRDMAESPAGDEWTPSRFRVEVRNGRASAIRRD